MTPSTSVPGVRFGRHTNGPQGLSWPRHSPTRGLAGPDSVMPLFSWNAWRGTVEDRNFSTRRPPGEARDGFRPGRIFRKPKVCWSSTLRADGIGPTSSTRKHVTLSSIHTIVIENFLATVESDETAPPALAAELRELLNGTGKLPDANQIVALVQSHTATQVASTGAA